MDERSQRSGYSRSRLDRTANRRSDPAWIAQALRSARFLLFSGERPLFRISGNPAPDPLFDAGTAQRFDAGMDRAVFLGLDGDTALFAAPVPGDEATFDAEGIKLIDVRSVAVQGLVAPALLGPVAQAKSLLDWHARHGYCARCGAETRMADAGYRRDCPSCGASHFPRTDPVVIMLPVDGADCLLARAPRFQPGMYSALAGFVEPGETIEDAVRREVKEETAVDVDRVTYHSSQPWPFPSSLMIGCFARAISRDLDPDPREIADARWFSRTEIGEMLNHRHPDGLFGPPSMAIAHQLLKSYVAGETIF